MVAASISRAMHLTTPLKLFRISRWKMRVCHRSQCDQASEGGASWNNSKGTAANILVPDTTGL